MHRSKSSDSIAISRAARPDAFRPDLARSLNNLADIVSDLGRPKVALSDAEEAVALYRDLSADRPAFRRDLAMSLNNLANILSVLDRREDALGAGTEAVGLYRELAAASPDAFRPELAGLLSSQADGLEGVGRLSDAVKCDHESVAVLAPALKSHAALAGPMIAYLKDYLRRAKAAGSEPDYELVEPIVERLQELI